MDTRVKPEHDEECGLGGENPMIRKSRVMKQVCAPPLKADS